MKRKQFLQTTIVGAATGLALGACRNGTVSSSGASTTNLPTLNWSMATSWPMALDIIWGAAQTFADRVASLTDGKFTITPRAGGELAPPLEVLNAVSQGAVPCGHTASYYYIGKSPAVAFGTGLPFGLTAQQQNAWLYEGGGLELLQELYARRFGVIQFPAGNTGAQMGGWFRREIATLKDLQGLKMRIPGLGGQVMGKLGVTVQTIPGGEIFQALQTGAIDATEWIGPYDDEKLGLHKIAEYYYYPGWWEPGGTLEFQVNLKEWNQLPVVYQEAIRVAAIESNLLMLARYDARNNEALNRLVQGGVKLRPYSTEILQAAEKATLELLDEFSAKDADFKTILGQWKTFRDRLYAWNNINEGSFERYSYRSLGSSSP